MNYPKRVQTHIMETKSWKILERAIPPGWMLRDITERDYGIDCYIEMVTKDGFVMGDLLSGQLKSVETLSWRNENGKEVARSPSISTSTINYWLGLPVPVFLFVADLAEEKMYFVSVKPQIRNQYEKVKSQKSISFKLRREFDLESREGLSSFVSSYSDEKSHVENVFLIRDLMVHYSDYSDFAEYNQGLDCYMGVEQEELLKFVHLYTLLQKIVLGSSKEWKVPSLASLIQGDTERWGDTYLLHNGSFDECLPLLKIHLDEVMEYYCRRIVGSEREYWIRNEIIIFQSAMDFYSMLTGDSSKLL